MERAYIIAIQISVTTNVTCEFRHIILYLTLNHQTISSITI